LGLIPRINPGACTTFEIRLSEKEEKKAILAIALKTVGFVGPPKGKLSDVELSIEQVSPC
jgi:hypothetical protein